MLNNQVTTPSDNSLVINTKYAHMKPNNNNNNKYKKPHPFVSSAVRSRQKLPLSPTSPHHNKQFNINNEHDKPLLTPPSSPEAIPRVPGHNQPNTYKKKINSTYEYNNRILAAKRNGNIRVVMNEFTSMKKNSVQMTHHTYNLVLESHAILRREGTPLTTMLKSNIIMYHH
jgi:hypothetical protein